MSSSKKQKPDTEVKYEIRDVVLAKVKGYPPWPGMIIDPETAPKAVKRERPHSKKTHFYCVRFFPAGDHSWTVAKDLSRLQPHEIQAYINEPHHKSGELMDGYKVAADPKAWEEEQEKKMKQAADEAREAEVDELDEDEDDAEGDEDDSETPRKKKKAGAKRKRESSSGEKKKSKASSSESSKKKGSASPGKRGKKNGTISAATVESEDDTETPDRPVKKRKSGDDELGAYDEEKVRHWRHKLQRGFLTKPGPPPEKEMVEYNDILTHVEKATPHLTIAILQSTKIGKVMRKISTLPKSSVPRDDEFKIRERAGKLVQSWQAIVEKHGKDGEDAEGEPELPVDGAVDGEKAVNGAAEPTSELKPASSKAKEDGDKMAVDEAAPEKPKEDTSVPMDTDPAPATSTEPASEAMTAPAPAAPTATATA
jgi:hypothetical protein